MPHDVVSLGEALVDFLPDRAGCRVREVARWQPCVGGAPANVAVGLARLGASSALVGVTGDDEFGHFLRTGLAREGVDVTHLRHTTEGKTGLGFVSLTGEGERSFVFYRTLAAETFLDERDTGAAQAVLQAARVLHLGTNSLVREAGRVAVRDAVDAAAARGQLVSCDPNLRLHLWADPTVLRGLLEVLLPGCSVVKLSEEETAFVTGQASPAAALEVLARWGVPLAVVTLGAKGAALRFSGRTFEVPAPSVQVVDTTGAGDGFMSGLLYGLTRLAPHRAALEALPVAAVADCAALGCAVGARAVQQLGAVAGLPTLAALGGAVPARFRS